MFSRVAGAKPISLTSMAYVPGATFRNVYCPPEPDVVTAFVAP